MNLFDLKSSFLNELSGAYPQEEIVSFFNILVLEYFNLKPYEIVLNREKEVSSEKVSKFKEIIERLKNFEPIQYIMGSTEFFGLPFQVSPSTLIPRPETEELVQLILDEVVNRNSYSKEIEVLDIGTGSGCIAISLAKNISSAQVTAMDISPEALEIAKMNSEINEVSVEFLLDDVLALKILPQKYDIIVSNPPYVRELEKKAMQANVLNHEPHVALFVKDTDPLLFYRKISELARSFLKPRGMLFFEINEYLGDELVQLLEEKAFHTIEIKKDIFGKDRMLKCTL